MYYIYDGTFYGLLTAIFLVFKHKCKTPEIKSSEVFKNYTFFEIINVETNDEFAERVLTKCRETVSNEFIRDLYMLYLSDVPESGNITYRYICAGLKYGFALSSYVFIPNVKEALKLRDKVAFEAHRMKGFVRFKEYGSTLAADITPDHNILPLLAKHFRIRYMNEKWIIRDTRRMYALIYCNGNTEFAKYTQNEAEIDISDTYADLWKLFYDTIAIDERTNPKLRRSYMPRRYWNNIIEMYDK